MASKTAKAQSSNNVPASDEPTIDYTTCRTRDFPELAEAEDNVNAIAAATTAAEAELAEIDAEYREQRNRSEKQQKADDEALKAGLAVARGEDVAIAGRMNALEERGAKAHRKIRQLKDAMPLAYRNLERQRNSASQAVTNAYRPAHRAIIAEAAELLRKWDQLFGKIKAIELDMEKRGFESKLPTFDNPFGRIGESSGSVGWYLLREMENYTRPEPSDTLMITAVVLTPSVIDGQQWQPDDIIVRSERVLRPALDMGWIDVHPDAVKAAKARNATKPNGSARSTLGAAVDYLKTQIVG